MLSINIDFEHVEEMIFDNTYYLSNHFRENLSKNEERNETIIEKILETYQCESNRNFLITSYSVNHLESLKKRFDVAFKNVFPNTLTLCDDETKRKSTKIYNTASAEFIEIAAIIRYCDKITTSDKNLKIVFATYATVENLMYRNLEHINTFVMTSSSMMCVNIFKQVMSQTMQQKNHTKKNFCFISICLTKSQILMPWHVQQAFIVFTDTLAQNMHLALFLHVNDKYANPNHLTYLNKRILRKMAKVIE